MRSLWICLLCLTSLQHLHGQEAAGPPAEAAPAPRAQDRAPAWAGGRVDEIYFIFTRVPPDVRRSVKASFPCAPGDVLTQPVLATALEKLLMKGLGTSVEARPELTNGKLKLTIHFTGMGRLGKLSFAGHKALEEGQLREQLAPAGGKGMNEGTSLTLRRLHQLQAALREFYSGLYYDEAEVDYQLTQDPQNEEVTHLHFTIKEGMQSYISKVQMAGNKAFTEEALQKHSTLQEDSHLDTLEVINTTTELLSLYHNNGYPFAKVVPRVERPYAQTMLLVYQIDEGPRCKVSGTHYEQGDPAPGDDFDSLLSMQKDQWYDGRKVKSDTLAIWNEYQSWGFADAQVETRLATDGPGRIRVIHSITEGQRYIINKIRILNNAHTQADVIRRELPFREETLLSTPLLAEAEAHLAAIGWFRKVAVYPQRSIEESEYGGVNIMDVVVDVTEQPTGDVQWGAGHSSTKGLTASITIKQSNFAPHDQKQTFRGGGVGMELDVTAATRQPSVGVQLKARHFLGNTLLMKLPAATTAAKAKEEAKDEETPETDAR